MEDRPAVDRILMEYKNKQDRYPSTKNHCHSSSPSFDMESVMLRPRFLPYLLFSSCLLLTACGGGGGGSSANSATPGTTTSPPSNGGDSGATNEPVQIASQGIITRANGKFVTSIYGSLAGLADEMRTTVPDLFTAPSILSIPSNGHANNVTTINFTADCNSGSIRYSGSFRDNDLVGSLTISHQNCDQSSGYKTNGSVRIQVRAASGGVPTAFDFTFDNYQQAYTDGSATLVFNGSMIAGPNGAGISSTTNLSVQYLPDGDYIQAQNLISVYSGSTTGATTPEAAKRSGNIAYSGFGYATVDTDPTMPTRTILQGAQQSRLRLDQFYYDLVKLSLDENGDGLYDAFLTINFSDLDNSYATNSAPGFSIISEGQARRDSETTIGIDSYFDSEDDFVSFSIQTLASPGNIPVTASVNEDQNIQFHTSEAGDYIFRVVANDGQGGTTNKDVHVHVQFPEPIISGSNMIAITQPGSTVALNIAPLNNPYANITYTVENGPPGMSVDNTGTVHWTTGSVPPFFHATDTRATISVSNGDNAKQVPIRIITQEPNATAPMVRTWLQLPKNSNGMFVGDFDNDGNSEILTTDHRSTIYTMKVVNGDYKQEWAYPYALCDDSIASIRPLAERTQGHTEIAVLCQDALFIIEAHTANILRATALLANTGLTQGLDMTVADADQDGTQDIVAIVGSSTYQQLVVIDTTTLHEKWRSGMYPLGKSVAVGNVDTDAHLEIVTSGGYVFDGATHAIKWNYAAVADLSAPSFDLNGDGTPDIIENPVHEFGSTLAVADLDGNGRDEIIGASTFNTPITIFDAVSQTATQEIPGTGGTCSLHATRLDANRPPTLIAGSCANEISAHNFQTTPALQWSSSTYGSHARSLTVGDVNDDGRKEVIWASTRGFFSQAERLQVMDADSQTELTLNDPIFPGGGFNGGQSLPRPSQEPAAIFVVHTSYSGAVSGTYAGPRLVSIDQLSGEISYSERLDSAYDWNTASDFCISDLNANNTLSTIMPTASGIAGEILLYDWASQIWQSLLGTNSGLSAISCADFTRDGHPDIGFTTNNTFQLYDAINSTTVMQGPNLNESIRTMSNFDIDHDGTDELIVQSVSELILYKSVNDSYVEQARYNLLNDLMYDSAAQKPAFADIDDNGVNEIIVARGNRILILNNTLSKLDSIVPGAQNITALSANSLSPGKILIATANYQPPYKFIHRIELLNLGSRQIEWQSPPIVGRVTENSLHFEQSTPSLPDRLIFGTQNAAYITH